MVPGFSCEVTGARLVLRSPPGAEWDQDAKRLFSNPKNLVYLPFFLKDWTDEEITAERDRRRQLQNERLALNFDIFLSQSTFIGIGGFRSINMEILEGEFGIILDHTAWRSLFSAESHLLFLRYGFEELKLETAFARTSEANVPMVSFFQRFGIPQTAPPNDEGWLQFTITASQWPQVKERLRMALSGAGK